MKKLLVSLLVLALLALPAAGMAGGVISLQNVPEIQEADILPPFLVSQIIAVDLGWDSVYHDPTIDTYIILPYSAEQIITVILTDGYTFVHGSMEVLGYNFLYVTFNTDGIRQFLTRGAYLVLIAGNE